MRTVLILIIASFVVGCAKVPTQGIGYIFTEAARIEAQNCLGLMMPDGSVEYIDTCEAK